MDNDETDEGLVEATDRISRLHINTDNDDAEEDTNGNVNALKAKFNKLVLSGKEKARCGLLEEALQLFLQAYDIHKSPKLLKRIEKLKEFIKAYEEEEEEDDDVQEEDEEDDGMEDVGNGFRLAKEISQALYPYQKQGLLWFWGLFKKKQGGILGDDMGLGKTIQVISFLAGMFDSELIKSVLIVMPVSLMTNWENEFKTWAPGIRVRAFHGSNKKERSKNLEKIQKKNGVCLTTYGLIVSSHETLSKKSSGQPFEWDYIILDEGHKIKNPTKTSKNVRAIPAKNHFILTGTPIQNNLHEMWSLFDFVCEGKLLGSSKTFKQEYENPITRARERDASAYEKRIGAEMAESMRKLIEPHFLRRTKASVLKSKPASNNAEGTAGEGVDNVDEGETIPKTPSAKLPESLMRKNDLILWLKMSTTQVQIYVDFLGLERVKEMLMSSRSPLAELNVLKKICDHPRLLSAMACTQLGLDEAARAVTIDDDEGDSSMRDRLGSGSGPSDSILIQESGKMVFLVALLDNLREQGHRCLIFSQSRKMLDIIQRVITHRGHKVLRIDGTITSTTERQRLITTFQTNPSYTCFLLTTQVGGVGITLTAADRVVIFDPSWNPATDAQAVDRAYRIGQKKCVVIYRLITCGSIEEKIYRKQIFKDALMKQTTGCSKNPFRYFSSQDLRDLFTLDDPNKSKTQRQLAKLHGNQRKTDEGLDKHIGFLHTLDHVFGITDHDLMYSQEAVETPEELAESGPVDAIQARVLRAQNMVAAESGAGGQYNPFQVPQPAAYENPKHVQHSRPSPKAAATTEELMEQLNRKTVQSKLHHFEVFQPSRTDNKRFMPGNVFKKPSLPPVLQNGVIDLSTPPITPGVPRSSPGDRGGDIIDLTLQTDEADLETSFAGLALDERAGNESAEESNTSLVHDRSEVSTSSRSNESCGGRQDSYSDEVISSNHERLGLSPADVVNNDNSAEQQVNTSTSYIEDASELITDANSYKTTAEHNSYRDTNSVEPLRVSLTEDHISDAAIPDTSDLITDSNSYEATADHNSYRDTNGVEPLTVSLTEDHISDASTSSIQDTSDLITDANSYEVTVERDNSYRDTNGVEPLTVSLTEDHISDASTSSIHETSEMMTAEHNSYRDTNSLTEDNISDTSIESPVANSTFLPSFEIDIEKQMQDSPVRTPRRKSFKNKRRSISQRPILDSDDDDDDTSKSSENQSRSSQQSERSGTISTDGSQGSEYEDAVSYISRDTPDIAEGKEVSFTVSPGEPSAIDDVMEDESDIPHRDKATSSLGSTSFGLHSEIDNSAARSFSTDVSNEDVSGRQSSEMIDDDVANAADVGDAVDGDDVDDGADDDVGEDYNDVDDGADARADDLPRESPTSPEIEHQPLFETLAGGSSDENSASEESSSESDGEESAEELPSDGTEGSGEAQSDAEGTGGPQSDAEGSGEAQSDGAEGSDRPQSDAEDSGGPQSDAESSGKTHSDAEGSGGSSSDAEDGLQVNKSYKTRRVRRIDSSESESDSSSSPHEERDNHSPSEKIVTSVNGDEELVQNHVGYKATKKYCCPTGKHQSDVIKIRRCACVLSIEEQDEYKHQCRLAERCESEGDATSALEHYMHALEIDQGDLSLHKKVIIMYNSLRDQVI